MPAVHNPYTSQEDLEQLLRLPQEEQVRVRTLIKTFETLPPHGCLAAIEALAPGIGLSGRSLRRLRSAWQRNGWQVLIRKYRNTDSLPEAFINYWKQLQERFQRQHSARQAYALLLGQWKAWLTGVEADVIPGYATPPLPAANGVPHGWSYANLVRHKSEAAGAAAIRMGHSAAREHAPWVRRTRVGMEVGQLYMFDDMWHDHLCLWPGHATPVRTLELAALDVFSGARVHWGLQPRLTRPEGTRTHLRESDMAWLLGTLLVNHGYHPAGCKLYVEGGTATIREPLERALHDLSGGKITVHIGGVDKAAEFAGCYLGNTKGNFRHKAHLESQHSLVHNMLGCLPGQTGHDRKEPTELKGRIDAAEEYLEFLHALPLELQQQLCTPFLTWAQQDALLPELYRRMNMRTNHRLEGWEEAGLVVAEVPGMSPEQFAALPLPTRHALAQSPGIVRTRRLSPQEVWDMGRRNLRRLPASAIHVLLGAQGGTERRVSKQGTFEFRDAEIGPGTFVYLARCADQYGHAIVLTHGERYLTYVNPFDPDLLHVIGPRGQYIGACVRSNSVAFGDDEAMKTALKTSSKVLAEAIAPMRLRAREVAAGRIAGNLSNAEVLQRADRVLADRTAEAKAARVRLPKAKEEDVDAMTTPAIGTAILELQGERDLSDLDFAHPKGDYDRPIKPNSTEADMDTIAGG